MLSWNVAIPIYAAFFLDGNPELAARIASLPAEDAAGALWSAQIRYLGVGAMLVGGLWALISIRSSLLSGVKSGLAAARAGAGHKVAHTEADLPMNGILFGVALFTLPLFMLYQNIVGDLAVSLPMTIIMIVAGFLFCSVSAYMAGLVGSSNNPVSGITICTILFASLVLMVLMGRDAALGPVAAIMIGAVVCCAACIGGDNLQDLKCGYIVGATPWKQQVMLAIGAASSALVMAPVLNLLLKAYGIGVPTPEHPDPLIAPQATLMASVAKGMFGGQLPWDMIAIGAVIGAAVIAWDLWLKARGSDFRAPVLAVAVGIYLPLELSVPIFVGGLIAHLVERRLGGAGAGGGENAERSMRNGLLFAAGMITGEALMGILIAIPIVTSGRADVLALPGALHFGGWLGLAIVGGLAWMLYRTGIRRSATTQLNPACEREHAAASERPAAAHEDRRGLRDDLPGLGLDFPRDPPWRARAAPAAVRGRPFPARRRAADHDRVLARRALAAHAARVGLAAGVLAADDRLVERHQHVRAAVHPVQRGRAARGRIGTVDRVPRLARSARSRALDTRDRGPADRLRRRRADRLATRRCSPWPAGLASHGAVRRLRVVGGHGALPQCAAAGRPGGLQRGDHGLRWTVAVDRGLRERRGTALALGRRRPARARSTLRCSARRSRTRPTRGC